MKSTSVALVLMLAAICPVASAQTYSNSSIFAHNDYVHPSPLHDSYAFEVGYIEADVFLVGGQLLVAHTKNEIDTSRTLDELYLKPLGQIIADNRGYSYRDTTCTLTLMIDLKSEGTQTVEALAEEIKKHPSLISCSTLNIAISGNVPDPKHWNSIPRFISIDGRPFMHYTSEQLERIVLISDSFGKYSSWNGEGVLPDADRKQIEILRNKVHALDKPLRFWATPDTEKTWRTLIDLRVNVIGTDVVERLSKFLHER